MLYFFHHYELPIILQQASLQELLANRNQHGMPHATVRRGDRLELVIQHVLAEQSAPPAAEPTPPPADPTPDAEAESSEPVRES